MGSIGQPGSASLGKAAKPAKVVFHDIAGLKIGAVPLTALVQRRTNHQRMTAESFTALQNAVQRFGFQSAIVVIEGERRGTFEVIDGHHRWDAAIAAGMKVIPAILVDKGLANGGDLVAMLSFNLKAELVPEDYLGLLREISAVMPTEEIGRFTGLDDAFLNDLLSTVKTAELAEPDEGGEDGSDRSRGGGVMFTLPRTEEIEALLASARAKAGVATDTDAVLAALRAYTKVEAGEGETQDDEPDHATP